MRFPSIPLLAAATVAALGSACSKPKPVIPQVDVTNATYQALTYSKDSSQFITTVQFNGDSTITLMTQVPGKNRGSVDHGHWSADWNTIRITLTKGNAGPEVDTMVYDATPDSLVPQKWNKALHGDKGITLLRQGDNG